MEIEFKAVDWNGNMHFLNLNKYMGFNESTQEEMCPFHLSDSLKLYSGRVDRDNKKIYDGDRLCNGHIFANVVYDVSLAAFICEYTHTKEWEYLHVLLAEGFYLA